MSRKSKTYSAYSGFCRFVGAACGAAVYFIRKGKADLETDFDDFKDEFEEEEPAPAERIYTTLPKTKGAEDAAPDPESAKLAIKVPKQLIQKLKAKPQSPKKKTLKKKAVRITKAREAPEAESGDDEADSCEEETTEETATAEENKTAGRKNRRINPKTEYREVIPGEGNLPFLWKGDCYGTCKTR